MIFEIFSKPVPINIIIITAKPPLFKVCRKQLLLQILVDFPENSIVFNQAIDDLEKYVKSVASTIGNSLTQIRLTFYSWNKLFSFSGPPLSSLVYEEVKTLFEASNTNQTYLNGALDVSFLE